MFGSSKRSGSRPKCLAILDPGTKPDNMIVGRESQSGVATVSGAWARFAPAGGRIAPSGLPENALDVVGGNRAAARLARLVPDNDGVNPNFGRGWQRVPLTPA